MYKCIYQDIPFIFIYKKEWLRFLKPNFIDFINFMKDENILFWHHEAPIFIEELNVYKNGKIFDTNKIKRVRDFLERQK